jgi:hypothetical protein
MVSKNATSLDDCGIFARFKVIHRRHNTGSNGRPALTMPLFTHTLFIALPQST